MLRRLPPAGEPVSAREERSARLVACRASITHLALPPKAGSASSDPDWVSQHQEAVGRLTQDYRKRMDLLEEPRRYLVEMELRLESLHVERNTLYAERQAQGINDESLRALVVELDLSEVSLRKRLVVARSAAEPAEGISKR